MIWVMHNKEYSKENSLLYPGYIEGNDLGNEWGVPTLFRLEVGLSHERQQYIVGHIVGSFFINKRNICQIMGPR